MVASECGSEHTFFSLDGGSDEYGSHRETVGDTFGTGNDVGANSCILMCEEAPCAAITRLDFIKNQEHTMFFCHFAQLTQEVVVDHPYAGHPLDSLDDDGGKFSGSKALFYGFDVIERSELYI